MNTYMKQMRLLAIFIVLMLGGMSCQEGFLAEENLSSITQANYFTTAAQAQASVTGIYPALQTLNQEIEFRGDAIWSLLEMPVGHLLPGGSQYKDGSINHTNSSNEPAFRVVWVGFYNGIANANLTIKKIPGITMNESTKQSLLGEAYFLRAFYYYYLVRLYGSIPLLTEPIDFASPDLYPNRAPVDQVYQLIVNDLIKAEKSGLPPVDKTGKASLGAVKSLLASVYLTMAGSTLNKGGAYYQLAADKAKEVLDGNYYTLFDNYNYLHDRAHKNQGELIFQVQYAAGILTNRITEFISPKGISKLPGDLGTVTPTSEFVKSYEPNDKRTQEKQFYFTKDFAKGSTTKIVDFGGYALYKFWLDEAAGPNGDLNSDENWTLLRLPEVMLTYAEASNEISGPTQGAYNQINLIRARAKLPLLSALTKESFREAIWRERYHELAYENKAYFDIQRTRKVYNLQAGNFVDAFTYNNGTGATFNEQYMLWPIPQSELNANPNLQPQNKGW
jgi:hypothetical protein